LQCFAVFCSVLRRFAAFCGDAAFCGELQRQWQLGGGAAAALVQFICSS
jgi:hypothetical protein